MTPTPKLRFVERKYSIQKMIDASGNAVQTMQTVRILQQWHAPFHRFHDGFGYNEQELKGGEWRDVPVEKE